MAYTITHPCLTSVPMPVHQTADENSQDGKSPGDFHFPLGEGEWIPEAKQLLEWVERVRKELPEDDPEIWHPAVTNFKNAIETDPELYMGFHRLFEVPYHRDRELVRVMSVLMCF